MQIKITHHNFELTESNKSYINEKLLQVEKHLKANDTEYILDVDAGKIGNHHKQGNNFLLKATFMYGSRNIHIECVDEDLYKCVDKLKDKLLDEVAHDGDKKRSIMKNFARRFKNIIKFGRD